MNQENNESKENKDMSNSALDNLLSGGTKSVKFENPGDTVTGEVTKVEVRQATEFGTGTPLTWDDGNPRQQIVVSLKTSLREDADDDGVRAVYVKSWGQQIKALRAASALAKGSPEPGDTFTATFTGFGPKSPRGGFPPKEYSYIIKKGSAVAALVNPQAPVAEGWATAVTISTENLAQITKLIGLSLSDEQIAGALEGVTVADVATVRSSAIQAAATSGAGF